MTEYLPEPRRGAPSAYSHAHKPSLTTNASGIPESVMSYASTIEVHAAQFPRPPSTIPASPMSAASTPSAWAQSPFAHSQDAALPLMARRPSDGMPDTPPTYTPSPTSRSAPLPDPGNVSRSRSFGPRAAPSRSLSRHATPIFAPPPLPEDEVVHHTTAAEYPTSMMSFDSRAAEYAETRTLSSDIISTSFITSLISQSSPRMEPQNGEDESIISKLSYPPAPAPYIPLPDRAPPSAFAGYHGRVVAETGMVPIGLHSRDSYQSSAADTTFNPDGSMTSHTPLREAYTEPSGSGDASRYTGTSLRPRRPSMQYPSSRQSMHSTRSAKSGVGSLISKISSHARAAIATPWRRKPLPPVPTLPHVSTAQAQQHRAREEALPLPELAGRAGELAQMLEKGYRPHESVYDLEDAQRAILAQQNQSAAAGRRRQHPYDPADAYVRTVEYSYTHPGGIMGVIPKAEKQPPKPRVQRWWHGKSKAKIIVPVALFLVVVVVAAVVASMLTHKKAHKCAVGLAGATCSLNAVCVNTASSGNSAPLAQVLVDLTPIVNKLFNENFTTNSVASALWGALGSPSGQDCSSQANLIDVSPTLMSSAAPNRTAWAQAALLWSSVQSQNVTEVERLRNFVTSAKWSGISADGPVSSAGNTFTITVLGYVFDFAAQTVSAPPQSFASIGQASSDQLSRLDNNTESTLDRMYTFGIAASQMQATAFQNYWTNQLEQRPSDLAKFMSAVLGSPILLPFDGTNVQVARQLTNSTTAPFPPPLACYPGLSSANLARVNAIETTIFGLANASAQTSFQQACYADRPIYGVLNLLQLRHPFQDTRTGAATQAVVLSRDTWPRAIVYSGEALSALPSASDAPPISSYTLDPRQYGTLANLYHVLLKWFGSINDTTLATAVAQFVLSSPNAPPANSSAVYSRIASIPPLEVAVFGNVLPTDVASVQSSFATPNGSLWFGADAALAMRQWAINAAGASVVWATNATSALVVRDGNLSDSTFQRVWTPAEVDLHAGLNVPISDVTNSLASLNQFTS